MLKQKYDCKFSQQLKEEFLKYEIRKITIHYTKNYANKKQLRNKYRKSTEKNLEKSLSKYKGNKRRITCSLRAFFRKHTTLKQI